LHIAARIAGEARDLVAGSGLTFEDCGIHSLKGLPEALHLYRFTHAS